MVHEIIALDFNGITYVRSDYEIYIIKNYDNFKNIHLVDDIFNITESYKQQYFIPRWQIDFLNGDYMEIENMNNVTILYSKE
jgi:hypothetical protein